MRKHLFLSVIILLAFLFKSTAQIKNNIIPAPAKIEVKSGKFVFDSCTRMQFDKSNKRLNDALAPLISKFRKAASINLLSKTKCTKQSLIRVILKNSTSNKEGYKLKISTQNIEIIATEPEGVFYAVQSLLQLLPESIESPTSMGNVQWEAPCVQIEDAPRFTYRGVMLDVSRHYMSPDSIKRIIDLLAMQKMNRFHWHLTDGDGWRFESKKYPQLTKIGAYRKGSPINDQTTYDYNSKPDESIYGGFYTIQQMKDIVKYAKSRFITIVPEIEMPGHASAAIASYPYLSCLDSNGHLFPYPQEIQGVFCTKEETFTFLTDILSEVMEIFPGEYIHIGGDEVDKFNWRRCKYCQQRMRDEGLKDMDELQSYFIKRIEKFVNSRGRSIIGWDEIMEGGLAPNASVMSWTGIDGGIKAAKSGHDVVMTPLPYCYLDHAQSASPGEPPAFPGITMLSNVYSFEPIPEELNAEEAKYITGAQGNLWTEFVPTASKAEYMLFPRSIALAEVTWSQPVHKNYSDFLRRLESYFKRLDMHQVNYSKHRYDIRLGDMMYDNDKFTVPLSGAENEAPMYYTLDNTTPDSHSPRYKKPIHLTQSCTVTAAIIINGDIVDLAEKTYVLNKAVGKKGTLKTQPDYNSNSGVDGWINGSTADDNFIRTYDRRNKDEDRYNEDKWIGWNGGEFNGTIDFGEQESINKVTIRFFNKVSSEIKVPKSVTLQTSDDGIIFKDESTKIIKLPDTTGAVPVIFSLSNKVSRFIRIIALPYGHTPGGGASTKIFVDEVIVE